MDDIFFVQRFIISLAYLLENLQASFHIWFEFQIILLESALFAEFCHNVESCLGLAREVHLADILSYYFLS